MGRYRYPYRPRTRLTDSKVACPVVAGVVLAALVGGVHPGASHSTAAASAVTGGGTSGAAAQAIAFAEQRAAEGCPYVYGATGPCTAGYDCSGLVYEAYGETIARTSEEQWATEPHVPASQVRAGDLVFFTGSPIDPPPGHVGLVVDPSKDLMVDAYAAGFPVEYDTYGPGASKDGLSDPTGFAQPWAADGRLLVSQAPLPAQEQQ
jgi:peptidoglycan DL-endopeptidase CwlO